MTSFKLNEVALALVLVSGILAFVILPLLRYQLGNTADTNKPRWAVAVLVFETAHLLVLAGLVSALATWASLSLATLGAGASSASMAQVIERLKGLKDIVDNIKVGAWIWGFLLAAIALTMWIMRSRRAQFDNARAALFKDKLDRLIEQFNNGTLPPLEPTPAMNALMAQIQAVDAQIETAMMERDAVETESKRELARAAITRLESERSVLLDNLASQDILRRVEISPHDPDLIGLPPPARTIWQKIGRVFVSRGVFRYLNLGQRALLLASVLLTIPTLLTVTGDTLSDKIESRIVDLDHVRVDLVDKEIEKRFEAASHAVPPVAEIEPAADEQSFTRAAYAHAHAFEQALFRRTAQVHLRTPGVAVPAARTPLAEWRAHDARRAILGVVAEKANRVPAGGGPESLPSGRRVEVHSLVTGAVPERIPLIDHPEHPISLNDFAQRTGLAAAEPVPRPVTPAGESLAREIVARGNSEAGFRQRIMQSFRASAGLFTQAARPNQLRAVLLAAALGGSAEGAAVANVITEPAARWAAETMEPGFRARAYQANSKIYLATLLETGRVDAALEAVETWPDHHLFRAEVERARSSIAPRIRTDAAVAADLQRFQPGLVELHDGITNAAARDAALTQYYGKAARRANIPAAQVEALVANATRTAGAAANFETYFPSDPSPGGGIGVPDGPRNRPSPGRSPAVNARPVMTPDAVRARSFVRLRGFARVGGVLIGRDPERKAKLDIRGIRWTLNDRRISIVLNDAAGRETTIGPNRSSIVYAALGYAADGRPLTVTMTKADPLTELRILLHPTLVDTTVGCRAIEIDRFVDEATARSFERGALTGLVEIQRSAYAYARIALMRAALTPDEVNSLIERDERVAGTIDALAAQTAPGSLGQILDDAMAKPGLLLEPKYSPLKVKTAFYHPRVVKLMEGCAVPGGTLAGFKNCVTETAARLAREENLRSMEGINWTAPTPEFESWSGVRERLYAIDPAFAFVGAGQGDVKPPEPFDFILQIAFTSPPYAAQSEPWFKGEPRDGDDTDPWLFSDSHIKITESVVDAIEHSPQMRDIYHAMREFVWMQRLFRAALAGDLGDAFPLERLTELARTTGRALQQQRTVRWQLNAGERRLIGQLQESLSELQPEGRQLAGACLAKVQAAGSLTKIYATPDEEWDRACRFSAQSLPKYLADLSEIISDTRRLRPALGIIEESQLTESARVCGPL